jgi:N-acetylneuraminic acid mutarotase
MRKVNKTRIAVAGCSGFYLLVLASLHGVLARSSSGLSLEWSNSTRYPEPCSGYAAGIIDGKLVIAGGTFWEGHKGHWTKKLFSSSAYALNLASQKWERLPDLPMPLGYAASTVVGEKLFVLGGYTGSGVNRNIIVLGKVGSRYVWSIAGRMNADRIFACAVSFGKMIYLVGGTTSFEAYDKAGTCCTTNTATKNLLRFDTDHLSNGYKELAPYPGNARWLPAVTSNGKSIWLFGGISQASPKAPMRYFGNVLRYDLNRSNWTAICPLPKAVADVQPLSALAVENRIVVFTGLKAVWQLDLRTKHFTETTSMPEGVYVDRFFWVDHRIVGVGGETQNGEGPRRRSGLSFIARVLLF